MARPQIHEPIILEELRRHPEGVTRRHLAEKAGCSMQQVHKIISKGKLEPTDRNYLPIETVGKGEFGADLVALVEGDRTTSVITADAGPRRTAELEPVEVPALGSRLQVVGMEIDEETGRVRVKVRDERGTHHQFTREMRDAVG